MKIRVDMTVDVDPETWEREYGDSMEDTAVLCASVISYVIGCVNGSAAAESGAIKTVTVAARW